MNAIPILSEEMQAVANDVEFDVIAKAQVCHARYQALQGALPALNMNDRFHTQGCLLYTSDAADDL